MKRKLYAELIILILLALCAVSACGAAESDTPEEPDYLQIAVDVVREQYPGIDPIDETEYCLFDIAGLSDRSIEFTTKSIQHGGISVDALILISSLSLDMMQILSNVITHSQ